MVDWLVVVLLIDWVHWFMWTLKNSLRTTIMMVLEAVWGPCFVNEDGIGGSQGHALSMKMVLVAVRTMLCQCRWR